MENSPEYEIIYYREVVSVMQNSLDDLKKFKKLWEEKKYRELYLHAYEFMTKNNIQTTEEFKKASEEYYWDFVN